MIKFSSNLAFSLLSFSIKIFYHILLVKRILYYKNHDFRVKSKFNNKLLQDLSAYLKYFGY